MKRVLTIAITIAFTALIAHADEMCTTNADCGQMVEAIMPTNGSCRTNTHDKWTSIWTYDSNGNLYDIGAHDCGIGPC